MEFSQKKEIKVGGFLGWGKHERFYMIEKDGWVVICYDNFKLEE